MNSRQKKQAVRAEKQFDEIFSGRVKVGMPEKRNKPAQVNRKGGGMADEESEDEMVADYMRLLMMLLSGAYQGGWGAGIFGLMSVFGASRCCAMLPPPANCKYHIFYASALSTKTSSCLNHLL